MKLLVDRRAGDLAVKERVLRHLLDDLVRVPDPLLLELYGKEVCRTFGLSEGALAQALEKRRGGAERRTPAARMTDGEPTAARPAMVEAELGALRLALLGAGWRERLVETLEPEDFAPGPARRLFEALTHPAAGSAAGGWLEGLEDEEERSLATRLALEDPPAGDPERLFESYAATLREARLEATAVDLVRRQMDAERRGDDAELGRLLAEQQALAQDRSAWRKRAGRT
jgi:hypothetical protein